MIGRSIQGVIWGAIAGGVDLIPMILQKLSWDANLSAFSMWVVIGFFIATSKIRFNPFLKGILFSILCLLPSAIIIGAKEPFALIPITCMTVLLGSGLGFILDRLV